MLARETSLCSGILKTAIFSVGRGMTRPIRVESLPSTANRSRDIGDRFVFSTDGKVLRAWLPNFVTKRFIRARQAAGLGHLRLHNLRDFMVTQMLDAGLTRRDRWLADGATVKGA